MTDDADAPEGETPMQRALRLKKAAAAERLDANVAGRKANERAAAARSNAKSKPWMRKY